MPTKAILPPDRSPSGYPWPPSTTDLYPRDWPTVTTPVGSRQKSSFLTRNFLPARIRLTNSATAPDQISL